MTRQKFPLTSDQLETLLAFEKKGSLNELAVLMAKDPSVVSRNLQRIAETLPVISKVSGRWNITPQLWRQNAAHFCGRMLPDLLGNSNGNGNLTKGRSFFASPRLKGPIFRVYGSIFRVRHLSPTE